MKKTLTYLIAMTALMLIGTSAMAQGGDEPYAGSTHGYKITPGDLGNTLAWEVVGGAAGTDYDINFTSASKDSINITWKTADGNPYTLRFTETDANSCSTVKELEINVQSNSFFLAMDGSIQACHDSTGLVLAAGASGPTTLTYTINVNKDAGFVLDSCTFDFTLTVDGTDYTLSSVKFDGGPELGTSGSYTGNVIPGAETSIDITVEITGEVTKGTFTTLAHSNGVAYKGSSTTPDNGTGPAAQVITVDPLPDTSEIQFN